MIDKLNPDIDALKLKPDYRREYFPNAYQY